MKKLIIILLFINYILFSTNVAFGWENPNKDWVNPYKDWVNPYKDWVNPYADWVNPYKDWQPPTPEEEALEEPLIDPIDILSLFGGIFSSLFKTSEKIVAKNAEKFVYHYFKDTTGEITESILKNGVKVSTGFTHTLGYEGKAFVSEISPDKISKLNLFAYGIGDANSFVKIAVKKSDLVIPAQALYYGEKGARIIGAKSGLYEIGKDGAKYLNRNVIAEAGSLAPYKSSVNSLANNILDAPRALTRYWLLGGGVALDINLFNKQK